MIVDKDLLLAAGQAQAGNERAFYYLYKRTYSDIYFRGMLLMEHKEQTKELCRQVYLLVYRRIGRLENIPQLSSWMYQILYTSAVKAWRSLPEYLIPEDKLEIVRTIEFYEKSEKLEEQVREQAGKGISRERIAQLSNNQRVVWKEHIWQNLSIHEISEHHQCEEKRIERYLEQAWDEIGRVLTEEEFSLEEAKKLYEDVCEMINEGIYPSLGSVIEKKEIQSEFANVYAAQNQPVWGALKEDEEDSDEEGEYEEYGDEEEEYEEGEYEEGEDAEEGYDKEKLDRKKKQMVILFATSGIVVFIIIAILLIKNGFGGGQVDDREYTRRETSQETKTKKKKESKKETTEESLDSSGETTLAQDAETSEAATTKKPKETTSKETTSKETTSKETTSSEPDTSQETLSEPDTSDTTALEPTDETSAEPASEPDSMESMADSTQPAEE